MLDEKFTIPNSQRKEAAGAKMIDGAEWLFSLFQNNNELQDVEQWMRYTLNKYTDSNNYSEKTFDDISSKFIKNT